MYFMAATLLITAVAWLQNPPWADDDESPDAYEIVTATAIPVLPPPLKAYFENHCDALRRSTTAYITPASTSGTLARAADRHYVTLDIAAAGMDAAARHAAARRFPHDHAAAIELSKRQGVAHGGSLPWVIHDHYEALVKAFRKGGQRSIVREAGALLHFGTDAALPFNTTVNRNGAVTGHVRWSDGDVNRTNVLHRTVRHRFHLGLLNRLRARFAYEVRVSPQRNRRVSRPLEAIFHLLLETYSMVDLLLAIDAETIADLGITDAVSFTRAADRYYDRLADRAPAIMESRLEAAALLGANLISTAWAQAGSPSPAAWTASTWLVPGEASSVDKPAGSYVGSRHSTIFHRVTCTHAKRIKPENLISFDTLQQADKAGRSPCKTCKPDGA